ncbi:MAG: hypothetical protein IPH93_12560 [Saprospiraceae bacterium]|nr:hypothetical protein [Saprospiraceae bacterium]MBK7812774.1 hypothetical protein [Saprospiraceae bacterium]MBK9630964.1 hypothetical protein [Saprospiraceae bacterium]
MSSNFTNLLIKLYWPILIIYVIILLAFVMLYFTEINNWSDRKYYNWMNFKRISIVSGIIIGALLTKYQGQTQISLWILYIPVAFSLIVLLFGLFIMYLYSKSI